MGKRGKRLIFAPRPRDVWTISRLAFDLKDNDRRPLSELKLDFSQEENQVKLRNYLIICLLARTGLRRAELVGQKEKEAICHCKQCRAWRLHQTGMNPEAIARKLGKTIGPRQVADFLENASKDGEHKREPMPGLYVKHIAFDRRRITVYGKGWASGRHGPEEVPVQRDVLEVVRFYIRVKKLRLADKLVPVSAKHIVRIIKNLSIKAGIPNAEGMSPHRLRAFFATDTYRRLKKQGKEPLLRTQRLMRHARTETTARYIDLTKDELQEDYDQMYGKQERDEEDDNQEEGEQ